MDISLNKWKLLWSLMLTIAQHTDQLGAMLSRIRWLVARAHEADGGGVPLSIAQQVNELERLGREAARAAQRLEKTIKSYYKVGGTTGGLSFENPKQRQQALSEVALVVDEEESAPPTGARTAERVSPSSCRCLSGLGRKRHHPSCKNAPLEGGVQGAEGAGV